jgi:uncharacterized membrane protein
MRSRAMRRATARYFWDRMKVSLWFVPLIMALMALVLTELLLRVDELVPGFVLFGSRYFISGTPGELRSIMISMAGTILATAGVVFSLLTLPLSTVASQFGSRLLRIFLRDRTTQVVLGAFVGTFCYCMSTALSIPNTQTRVAAPQITVTVGLYLVLATFAMLILLIQHISTMLQAPNIVAAAGSELREVVDLEPLEKLEGNEVSSGPDEHEIDALVESEAYSLRVNETGYIQFVDPQIILNLAKEKDLVIRLLRKPGQFVWSGEAVALVWPAARVQPRLAKNLRRAIQVGNQRTPTQDVEYAINQLVEISVRAMSPAINDPFTAMTCLDHLADGLVKYVRLGEVSPYFYDNNGQLRLIFEPAPFVQLVDAAFNMLRHASRDNASVLLHLLDAIEVIGQEARSPEMSQELLHHVHLVQAESLAGALIEPDREQIRLGCERVEAKFSSAGNSVGL